MKTCFVLLSCLFLFLPPSASASTLSDSASTLKAGVWREIFTSNVNILGSNGSSNLPYTDDITYDPNSKRLYYIGGDHCTLSRFISYNEASNIWEVMPRPSWLTTSSDYCNGVLHGYDNGALDQTRGFFYHARGFRLNRFNTATQVWSATPDLPSSDPHGAYNGVEFFPELGGVAYVDQSNGFPGSVYLYKESTNQWTKLASGLAAGTTYQYAEYNPVHHVMIFALGSTFYKLSSAGQVTPIKAPPFSLYNGSGYSGVLTVDPNSGLYLALTPDTRQLYTYNVLTDTWQLQSSPIPNMSNRGVVATPLAAYGVTLFTACNSTCRLYLYKHAGGSSVESRAATTDFGRLSISPNPVRDRASIQWVSFPGEKVRAIDAVMYDLQGRKVCDLKRGSSGFELNARNLPAGVYTVKITADGGNFFKRLLVQR